MKKVKAQLKKYLYAKVAPGYMDEELFKFLPDKVNVFMDVGAHTGSFTKLFHSKIKTGTSYLFEPIPEFYQKIKEDTYFKNCHTHNIALSSTTGEAEFSVNELPETSSLLHFDHDLQETLGLNKKVNRRIKVLTESLDNFARDFQISKIDFIKIDVQGAEMDVLKGAEKILPNVDWVFTEVSFKPIYKGSSTFDQVFNFFVANNFIMVQLIPVYRGEHNELLQCDVLFVNRSIYGKD